MNGQTTTRIGRDERETMRAGMAAALAAQMGRAPAVDGPGRAFMAMTLCEMAAHAAGDRGPLRSVADRERVLMAAFHSAGDFPAILEDALNKRLQAGYEAAQPVYRQIAAQSDFSDFRPHSVARTGAFPLLERIAEGGEITFGTVGEAGQAVTVVSYGKGLHLSRQAWINDDLSAFDRVIRDSALSAYRTEEAAFFEMFLSGENADGPVLAETGRQVFNTTDGTKAGAGAALDVDTLKPGRAAIRKHKGLGGEDLALAPAVLLVGPDLETDAEKLIATITPATAGAVNPFSGRLVLVTTAQITGGAWYLLTAPEVHAAFTWGLLAGYEAPRVRIVEPFGRQGVSVTVEHDFGCGAVDWRGVWKNAGA